MDDLTALVSEAAAVVRRIGPQAARMKADHTPVCDADEAAEILLLEGLARLAPGVPVVSEEACARGVRPRPGTRFFLVDPLDGTREFLAGLDEYTVNVALVADGVPQIGIIAAPAQGRVWRGAAGRGAERFDLAPGAAPAAARNVTPLRPRPQPAHGLIAAVSRSHLDPRTAAFVAALPGADQLACGSSLKFCRLAEGQADVYPRLAPTSEWDIAAGHAVLTASGGVIRAPDGAPVAYGRAEEFFRVPGFVAWADPAAATPITARGP
ncbi:MAG: 3'(2'),5'-bisphosphate nucleotidase CysQ [Hyphomicrobiales bacterium]|nr:3'(2'),5'-bisphosphate nucleotidase CysQ [Hyphomicrobiales bacterium]MBV8824140.1 3'(2'),5'-bisphosphate nucleotidase CysQ [Hyphomicrobiales bacterium]MBV9428276.1 3'(2'),5'-bisphosphate nucleotidase CysQ [Bradyrhizobiaceae bacterium]